MVFFFQSFTLSPKSIGEFGFVRFSSTGDVLTREARNALELGKNVGIQFQGDEKELIRDLVRLEDAELINKES
ncbi:hypothetical protein V6N13_009825 [Hibiscus sabdariffa]|uniref:RRM domain-containing protein n=2 Tax=Hibiscus sabdariffa TaxID=183260 RepID=A0ABR2BC56_9ROSI